MWKNSYCLCCITADEELKIKLIHKWNNKSFFNILKTTYLTSGFRLRRLVPYPLLLKSLSLKYLDIFLVFKFLRCLPQNKQLWETWDNFLALKIFRYPLQNKQLHETLVQVPFLLALKSFRCLIDIQLLLKLCCSFAHLSLSSYNFFNRDYA